MSPEGLPLIMSLETEPCLCNVSLWRDKSAVCSRLISCYQLTVSQHCASVIHHDHENTRKRKTVREAMHYLGKQQYQCSGRAVNSFVSEGQR